MLLTKVHRIEAMPRGLVTLPAEAPGVSHIDQYFGPWAVRESAIRPILRILAPGALVEHIRAAQDKPATPKPEKRGYTVDAGDVAVVQIVGTLTKYGSSLSDFPGTIRMRHTLRQIAQDRTARSVVLRIDSPGGTVAGIGDLAQEIKWLSDRGKPVVAFCEDTACSAAYWLASQADKVLANDTALVGSIGAYLVLEDTSAAAAARGVKVFVVSTGPYKGAGEPGTAITDDHVDHFQRLITGLNQEFLRAVGSGRHLADDRVRTLATGEMWVGAGALSVGLIDAVGVYDDAVGLARELADKRGPRPSDIAEGALSVGKAAASVPATKTKASGRPTTPTAATKSKTAAGTARQSAPAKPAVSKEEAEQRLAASVVRQIIINKAAGVWRRNPEAQRFGSMQDWVNVDLAAEKQPPMCALEVTRLNATSNPGSGETTPTPARAETARSRIIRESVETYQLDPWAKRLTGLRAWVNDDLRERDEVPLTPAEAGALGSGG